MDFWFAFKKTIAVFLNPVSITLEFICLGLFLLLLSRSCLGNRRIKAGRARKFFPERKQIEAVGGSLVFLGALMLYLCSIDPVADSLTLHLEKQSTQWVNESGDFEFPEEPAFIVVLAGGRRPTSGKPVLSQLNQAAFARTVQGVDLWKQFPEATFVVTGHPEETIAMRAVAERLGISSDLILEETESRDTKDHPAFLKPILGEAPFLLVTSGTHLPRALLHFRSHGLKPIGVPADLQSWPSGGTHHLYQPRKLTPRPANLNRTAVALHEILGTAWAELRGQFAASASATGE